MNTVSLKYYFAIYIFKVVVRNILNFKLKLGILTVKRTFPAESPTQINVDIWLHNAEQGVHFCYVSLSTEIYLVVNHFGHDVVVDNQPVLAYIWLWINESIQGNLRAWQHIFESNLVPSGVHYKILKAVVRKNDIIQIEAR